MQQRSQSHHHRNAAEHHARAAEHHRKASRHSSSGDLREAAHHAHAARGHSLQANEHANEASKQHAWEEEDQDNYGRSGKSGNGGYSASRENDYELNDSHRSADDDEDEGSGRRTASVGGRKMSSRGRGGRSQPARH